MPFDVRDSDEFRGAQFTHADLSDVRMHDVNLSGARITDAMLVDTELSGIISTLKVNGVYVGPLVEAELDRLHPERVAMRATTPDGLREGWAAVEAMWQPTIELAHRLPEPTLHQRVDGEWSLVETLRHLIFVTDGWFSRTVLGEADPYHPIGILPTFLTAEAANLGIDEGAAPSFAEVLDVRAAAHCESSELPRNRRRTHAARRPASQRHRRLPAAHRGHRGQLPPRRDGRGVVAPPVRRSRPRHADDVLTERPRLSRPLSSRIASAPGCWSGSASAGPATCACRAG